MKAYGEVAVRATNFIRTGTCNAPSEAWKEAALAVFPHSTSLQEKSCPRSAYLGLCEAGLVSGVRTGSYTRSRDNKEYALRAVQLLKQSHELAAGDAEVLWTRVMEGKEKASNSQMDVVIGLWENGLIAKE